MILLRRSMAVLLGLLLVPALALSLVLSHVTATVMSPDFYVEQLRELGAYALVHDEVLPQAVDDFLSQQDERVPDNLSGIALPSDEHSRQAILDLLRVALPPEAIQAHAESAIEAIVPYVTGARDGFDVRIRLGDTLIAVAGHEPGEPSVLQQTWRELDLAEATLHGLLTARMTGGHVADARAGRAAVAAVGAGASPPGLLDVLGDDIDGASAWLERQLFGAIDELVPYLTGDAEHVRIVIRFDDYPLLAEPLAQALHRTPQELLTTGFVIDDREINAELAKSGRDEIKTADNALAIFRPAGYSFTERDLPGGDGTVTAAAGTGGANATSTSTATATADDGIAIDDMRTWGARVRLLRRALIGLVALLVVGIACLGGRRWPSRVIWGASGLLAAAALVFTIAGPVYPPTAGAALERQIAAQRAEDAGAWGPIRDHALARAEAVIDGSAGRVAATARNWGLIAALAIGGSVAWSRYDRRRPGPATRTVVAAAERGADSRPPA